MMISISISCYCMARSNFDHYARECEFGILKKKQNKTKNNKNKKTHEKSFGCVLTK